MSVLLIAALLLAIYLVFFSNDNSNISNYHAKTKPSKKSVLGKESLMTTNDEHEIQESNQDPVKMDCGGFVSSELLPKPDQKDEDFGEFAPSNVDGNFLDSSKFLSMQTSLLRNSNLQIRPDPEIPRENVCPWNNSTIFRENTESSALKKSEEF